MVSPQTPVPNQPVPQANRPIGNDLKIDTEIATYHLGWKWVLTCTAIVILVCIWAIWGFAGTGGWWMRNLRSRAAAYGPSVARNGRVISVPTLNGPGIAALDATDKKPFIGQPFTVNGATVRENAGSQALWIGPKNSPPMLVVLAKPFGSAKTANIAQGDPANVTGTIEKAPPAKQAQSKWSLSDDDTQRLEQEGVYIQATKLQPAEQLPISPQPANS
jgi:hypothetical protein